MLPYRDEMDVSLPNTDAIAARNLVLPSGPTLTSNDIDAICDILELGARKSL